MAPPKIAPTRQFVRDPEVQKLLGETDDALVRSTVRLRQARAALIRSREQNAEHRKHLELEESAATDGDEARLSGPNDLFERDERDRSK